ncbi:MAG: DUF4249 domain-containing protein [Bacteroidota bacterium]
MIKNIVFVALLITILTSCFREPIDFDLNDGDPQIVITGWITDDSTPQFVSVTRSTSFLGEQSIDYVDGAEATISTDQETYFLEERETGRFFLPEDWTAITGQTYRLEVNYEGNNYTATHEMRAAPTIQNPLVEEITSEDDSILLYQTLISFDDPVGEGDGYFIIDYQKGTEVSDFIERGFVGDDEFIDGEMLEEVVATNFDHRHEMGDTVIIELYSIGQNSSDFIEEVLTESFRGESPFETPPVNVSTNISGGALGYFVTSGMQRVEIIIEE